MSGEMGQVSLQLGMEGGILWVGGLDHSQVGRGFHDLQGGPFGPKVGAVADPLIMATNFSGVDDEVVVGGVEDGHIQ